MIYLAVSIVIVCAWLHRKCMKWFDDAQQVLDKVNAEIATIKSQEDEIFYAHSRRPVCDPAGVFSGREKLRRRIP